MRRRQLALLGLAAVVPLGLEARSAPAAKPLPSAATIQFSGYTWDVKDSSGGRVGPGPNIFSGSNVWLDAAGRLHLRITKIRGRWTCAEVINTQSLGLGTYTWVVESPVDVLDPSVVLGLFTYSDDPAYHHRELDVEYSRWGNAADTTNGQYVVQPYDHAGNRVRMTVAAGAAPTTHGFTWGTAAIDFFSDRSSLPTWRYAGPDVPQAGSESARINLWLFRGAAPTNGRSVELVIRSFAFTPLA
jgi:hypothetical protein